MMFPTTEEYPMRRPQIRSISLLVALTVVACQEPTAPAGSPAPAVTATSLVWTQVTVGGQHACALASNGRAYCWGHAEAGQLGTGTTPIQVPRPTRVSGALQFAQISAGTEHTCAVTTDSKAYCWGENGSGELGDGTTTSRTTPVLGREGGTSTGSGPAACIPAPSPGGQGLLLGRQQRRCAGRWHHHESPQAGGRGRRPRDAPAYGWRVAHLRGDHRR